MTIVRGGLRTVLIWIVSGLAAPYVGRGFSRLARLAPSGSFLEATLLELTAAFTAMFIRVVAEVLTS
jgi:hypothetical protein